MENNTLLVILMRLHHQDSILKKYYNLITKIWLRMLVIKMRRNSLKKKFLKSNALPVMLSQVATPPTTPMKTRNLPIELKKRTYSKKKTRNSSRRRLPQTWSSRKMLILVMSQSRTWIIIWASVMDAVLTLLISLWDYHPPYYSSILLITFLCGPPRKKKSNKNHTGHGDSLEF